MSQVTHFQLRWTGWSRWKQRRVRRLRTRRCMLGAVEVARIAQFAIGARALFVLFIANQPPRHCSTLADVYVQLARELSK